MDDLISRQAVIDAMCELMHHWFGGDPKDEIREIKRELEKLPSVQPRKGKWIPHQSKYGIEGEMVYECSYCGENVGFYPHNFCPYCGSYNGGDDE